MKKDPFAPYAKAEGEGACSETEKDDGEVSTGAQSAEASGTEESLLRTPGEYATQPELLEVELARLHLENIEEGLLRALEQLVARTQMPIGQNNGQRTYGPPLDPAIKEPPRGSEVFVGKIPRDCMEPELVPVFEKAGRIYMMRLMMDFSGSNRGYCFVQYFTPEEADRAVAEINKYEIRKGRPLGVTKSVDNSRLYIGGLPVGKTEEEIFQEVNKLAKGVVKVIIPGSKKWGRGNKSDFAFVDFESHKAAAMARRLLVAGNVKMWDVEVVVEWGDPPEEKRERAKAHPQENRAEKEDRQGCGRRHEQVPRTESSGYHPAQNCPHRQNYQFAMTSQQQRLKPGMYMPVHQHAVLQPGFITSNGFGNRPNHQGHANAFQQFETKPFGTSTVAQNQIWGTYNSFVGVPGIPPSVFLAQWSKSQQGGYGPQPSQLMEMTHTYGVKW